MRRRFTLLFAPLLLAALPAAAPEMKAGFTAAEEGRWQEARGHFQSADKLSGGDARILNNLAVTAEALGNFPEAKRCYEQALLLEPDNARLKENFVAFKAYSRRLPDLWPAAASSAADPIPARTPAGAP
jgi:Flp pilus assembly protein TadD